MVNFTIEDRTGERQELTVPVDMGLSLMEVLKGSEYDILATCGGMALCATCHVEVLAGGKELPPISDAEIDMLDTLPNATDRSRLACQLRIAKEMEGTIFKIPEEVE
ncbi:2Fe-2S iron-sulfur cluster-binding protein [Sphingobacterium daejeonense]|uniref:2Fe-2S iron-sulfur cluster-binding protein n=1 Tax=Sphingobacterium daejeonense TaxID=371142 RepID=UPI0010C3F428|nr:2Fe-2S iron-sulfur cluster-binding protein [Sphingobacterium daejeonense]VTP91565.1 Rhodocoxin [Sphingobacterium daejeonense]